MHPADRSGVGHHAWRLWKFGGGREDEWRVIRCLLARGLRAVRFPADQTPAMAGSAAVADDGLRRWTSQVTTKQTP